MKKYAYDDTTGQIIQMETENQFDYAAAIVSMVYLLGMLGIFFWQLLDVWIGQYTLIRVIGYPTDRLGDPILRLVSYTVIGGGLGGAVNGIRSMLLWHVELGTFNRRYLWKYVALPWLGATLALFVLAIVRSGVAALGAEPIAQEGNTLGQTLSTLIVGILAGYGAREVFIWLDAQVARLFRVGPAAELMVPDLIGKSRTEAGQLLETVNLKLGEVTEETVDDASQVDLVLRQSPAPQAGVLSGSAVDVTVGVR